MDTKSMYSLYLSESLVEEIDRLVSANEQVYKSRSHFIEQAIDVLLDRLKRQGEKIDPEIEMMLEKEKKKSYTLYLDIERVQELDRYVRQRLFKSRAEAVEIAIKLFLKSVKSEKGGGERADV